MPASPARLASSSRPRGDRGGAGGRNPAAAAASRDDGVGSCQRPNRRGRSRTPGRGRRSLGDVHARVRLAVADSTTPDTRLVDDPMPINPIQADTLTSLNQLMVGGIYMYARSIVAYTRLRYFDADQRRSGIPDDVAALVEGMSDDTVTVSLINVNPLQPRTVVVQGGAFGEHQIIAVHHEDRRIPVEHSSFQVHLAPGTGTTLTLEQRRYANKPSYAFPWDR